MNNYLVAATMWTLAGISGLTFATLKNEDNPRMAWWVACAVAGPFVWLTILALAVNKRRAQRTLEDFQ